MDKFDKTQAFDLGIMSFNKGKENPYIKDSEEYLLWEMGFIFQEQGKIFDEMIEHIKWQYNFYNNLIENFNNPNLDKKEFEQKLKFGQLCLTKFLPELFKKE